MPIVEPHSRHVLSHIPISSGNSLAASYLAFDNRTFLVAPAARRQFFLAAKQSQKMPALPASGQARRRRYEELPATTAMAKTKCTRNSTAEWESNRAAGWSEQF
jgi:hypothetical protein